MAAVNESDVGEDWVEPQSSQCDSRVFITSVRTNKEQHRTHLTPTCLHTSDVQGKLLLFSLETLEPVRRSVVLALVLEHLPIYGLLSKRLKVHDTT